MSRLLWHLGDSIIYSEENPNLLKRMIMQYEKCNPSIVLATRIVPDEDVSKYGIVKPASDIKDSVTEIKDVVEKPLPQNAPSNLAFAARYILPPDIFNALERTGPGKGGEIQLTDAISILLKEGMKGYSVQLTEREKGMISEIYHLIMKRLWILLLLMRSMAISSGNTYLKN